MADTTLNPVDDDLIKAIEHHQAGRLLEARLLYRLVLDRTPDEPDALHLLGQLEFAAGSSPLGATLIRKAIANRPDAAEFHLDLARIERAAGNVGPSIEAYRKALELDPSGAGGVDLELAQQLSAAGRWADAIEYAERAVVADENVQTLSLAGQLAVMAGRVQLAVDRLERADQIAPGRADVKTALAGALRRRGDLERADAVYRDAIRVEPAAAEPRLAMGVMLLESRRWAEAASEFRSVISMNVAADVMAFAHAALGDALSGLDQPDDAIEQYRQALSIDPKLPTAWAGLSKLLVDLGEWAGAEAATRQLLAVARSPQGHAWHAAALAGLDRLDESVDHWRTAVDLDPQQVAHRRELGRTLRWAGRLPEAIAALRGSLRLSPDDAATRSELCYATLADDGSVDILGEHVEWGRRHGRTIDPLKPPRNERSPDRRLRVGYVSPNFRAQAMLNFLPPIFRGHDRSTVEVLAYSDVKRPDGSTALFRKSVDQWRDVAGLTDRELAERIRADRIDVLVELTGHIGGGRLGALAYRPAPVQVSYLGYQGTTGSPEVDYVVTDSVADPVGAEAGYVETPVRLPGPFFVYDPPGEAGLVSARRDGPIRFGCLNAVFKVTPTAVRLWSRVLANMPGSTMAVVAGSSQKTRRRIIEDFAAGGIAADRVDLIGRTDLRSYFRHYESIDIALDPVPMVGHTTTCDAAWMGVPTITLAGSVYAHRYGGSALAAVGLNDLIAHSPDQYVAAAVSLANDPPRLAGLRRTLRLILQRSPVMNGPRFCRTLEAAYREMWCRWVATSPKEAPPFDGNPAQSPTGIRRPD